MDGAADIVVAGHLCLDIIPTFPENDHRSPTDLFKPGSLVDVNEAQLSTGGVVSNTGIALSKLGHRPSFISILGDDAFANVIIQKMKLYGNCEGLLRRQGLNTSYSIILAPASFDRIFLHHPGSNHSFNARDVDDSWIQGKHFHLGYPPLMRSFYLNHGDEVVTLLKKAKAKGLSTSIDFALPDPQSEAASQDWSDWFKHVLPHVDFFVPSCEEMFLLLEPDLWKEHRHQIDTLFKPSVLKPLVQQCLEWGAGVVVLKAGSRGLYALSSTQERLHSIPLIQNAELWAKRELWSFPFKVNHIQSAAGAGDAAVAGMLSALLHSSTIEELLQTGNCLGWQNLRALDTVSGVGDWKETQTLLKNLDPQIIELEGDWKPTSLAGIVEFNNA